MHRHGSVLPQLALGAWLIAAPAAALAGCAPLGQEGGQGDLGSIGTKDDASTSVRTVAIDIAPGSTKRFRVRAHRFHAALAQGSDVPAALSARHYDLEIQGETATDPEVEAAAPPGAEEELRTWTLRVHNLGTERLAGELTVTAVEELPEGGLLRQLDVVVEPFTTRRYRVGAASMEADLAMEEPVMAQLSAKHYGVEAVGEPSTRPTLRAQSPDGAVRNWTLRIQNLSAATLVGRLSVRVLDEGGGPGPGASGGPTLADPIRYENEYCTYADSAPYVRAVHFAQPLVQAAARRLVAGHRSTMTYAEWRVPYGLESESGTEEERALARTRNFLRVLCGELRDHPELLRQRLEAVVGGHHYASPGPTTGVDTTRNLFTQLTYDGYVRLVSTMGRVYAHRRASLAGEQDGFHYGFGEPGHGSNRVDHAVAPWTHCEMKFMFERYLGPEAPTFDGPRYEEELASYQAAQCTSDDLGWMYDFRGHFTYQPLWLESNGFMYNSRRARGLEISRGDRSYYLRPYASRYDLARRLMATYLLYRDEDRAEMITASERNGGHILYVLDEDSDADGLLDYKLFDQWGCGDAGVQMPVPSENCNMVSWEQALSTPATTGHASSWDPQLFGTPDLGFMRAFTTFEERMARLNQAMDRHTNWGPTSYYMTAASQPGDASPRFRGNISPFVAASYDVSKSDFFARRDNDSTDAWERGRAKWLFVMRFRAERYYSEENLRAGHAIDLDRHYFNETSLSNDWYREHGLDHWGAIPGEEHYAQVYLAYGDHGIEPPAEPAEVSGTP